MKVNVARTHIIATAGARTAKGGTIEHASGEVPGVPIKVVRVGDLAVYPDGSAARVVSGCGEFHLDRGLPLAIVGSALHNGDVIIDSPFTDFTFYELNEHPVAGLLQSGWHRFRSGARKKSNF